MSKFLWSDLFHLSQSVGHLDCARHWDCRQTGAAQTPGSKALEQQRKSMSWFEDKLPAVSLAYFQPQKNVGMFTDSACRKPAQLEFQFSWQRAPSESQSGQGSAPKSQPVPYRVLLASRVQQLRGHSRAGTTQGEAKDGRRSWDNQSLERKAAGEKSLAVPGWLLWGFPEEDEASPSPELLCPLVANKGAETEEVTPVPPASAQGWHSRACPLQKRPHGTQWVAKMAWQGNASTPSPGRQFVTAFSPNNICPQWNWWGREKIHLGDLEAPSPQSSLPPKA